MTIIDWKKEIETLLIELSNDIKHYHQIHDLEQMNRKIFIFYLFSYIDEFPYSKKSNRIMLPALFDVLTTYPWECDTFAVLPQHFNHASLKPKNRPDDLHFSLEKVLDAYKRLYKDIIFQNKKNVNSFYDFLLSVRYYFDENDADKLIAENAYRFGNTDRDSYLSTIMFFRLYPPKYFRKIIIDAFNLLKNLESAIAIQAVLFFINGAIQYDLEEYGKNEKYEKFNWLPHLNTIFKCSYVMINASATINTIQFNQWDHQTFIIYDSFTYPFDSDFVMYLSSAIPSLIIDGKQGDEVLNGLETFINIVRPLFFTHFDLKADEIHYVNESTDTFEVNRIGTVLYIQLISRIIMEFAHLNKKFIKMNRERKLPSEKRLKYESQNISKISANKEQIRRFVKIFLSFIEPLIFHSHEVMQKMFIVQLKLLIELDYDQVAQIFLQQSVDRMIDDEMSPISSSYRRIVINFIPALRSNLQSLFKYANIFSKIIYSAVECLDTVDTNIFMDGLTMLSLMTEGFIINDNEEHELLQGDQKKLDETRNTAIESLESTFDQFVEYFIRYKDQSTEDKDNNEESERQNNEIMNLTYPYFHSFSTRFLQSKLPFLYDKIDEGTYHSSLKLLISSLTSAKLSLIEPITQKLFDRFDHAVKHDEKKKKIFLSGLISSIHSCSPHLPNLFNQSQKRIIALLQVASLNNIRCIKALLQFVLCMKQAIIINDDFNPNANLSTSDFVLRENKYSNWKIEWFGKINNTDKIFDIIFTNDLRIKIIDFCISITDKLIRLYECEDEKGNSANIKIQREIILILVIFIKELFSEINPGELESKSYLIEGTELDFKIKSLKTTIRDFLLKYLRKYNSQKVFNRLTYDKNVYLISLIVNTLNTTYIQNYISDLQIAMNRNRLFSIYNAQLLDVTTKIENLKPQILRLFYYPKYDREVMDEIYSSTHSPNHANPITGHLIAFYSNTETNANLNIALKDLHILETQNQILSSNQSQPIFLLEQKTKEETELTNSKPALYRNESDVMNEKNCQTCLSTLSILCRIYLMRDNTLYARFLNAFINLKFDKKWDIGDNFNALLDAMYSTLDRIKVPNDIVWKHFLDSLFPSIKDKSSHSKKKPNLPIAKASTGENYSIDHSDQDEKQKPIRMIDDIYYYKILYLIAYQQPHVNFGFLRFCLKMVINSNDANRQRGFSILAFLFSKMNPKAKAVIVSDVPSDVYCDRSYIHYFKNYKPQYKIYPNLSEFDSNDGFQELRDVVLSFFNKEKIELLLESIELLQTNTGNSNGDDNSEPCSVPKPASSFIYELALLLRTNIIEMIKDKLLDIASNGVDLSFDVLIDIFTQIFKATRYWSKDEIKLIENEIFIPIFTKFFQRISVDMSEKLTGLLSEMAIGMDVKRFKWFFDLISSIFDEIILKRKQKVVNSTGKDEGDTKTSLFIHLLAGIMKASNSPSIGDLMVSLSREKILPALGETKDDSSGFDFENNSMLCVNELAELCGTFAKNEQFAAYQSGTKPKWSSLPFENIFDVQFKKKNYDKLSYFMSIFLTQPMNGFGLFIPYIGKRIEDILLMISNLTIKYQSYGTILMTKMGLLDWGLYPDLLINDVLIPLEKAVTTQSVGGHGITWMTKWNIVGFLHTLCFNSVFDIPKEVFEIIFNRILPYLINDKNENVKAASMEFLVFLIHIVYCLKFDILADECLTTLKDSLPILLDKSRKKDKIDHQMIKCQFTVAVMCALIYSTSIANTCPKWLPEFFQQLEDIYFKGNSLKSLIKICICNFWHYHARTEIPELEEYRYTFSDSYYA